MKKSILITLLLSLMTISVFAQQAKLAILLPAKPGEVSEVIPINKKELKNLLSVSSVNSSNYLNSPTGIIDTLINDFNDYFFEFQVGDTGAVYFNSPAECYIKAVGLIPKKWDNNPAEGFNLKVTESNWHVTNTPEDSVDETGWAGYWDDNDNWIGSSWGLSPVGEMLWGELAITVTEDGIRIWTDLIYLGIEFPPLREFMVVISPFGEVGESIGFLAGDAGTDISKRLWKYYREGTTGPDGIHYGWFIRHFALNVCVVVEFVENTPPFITASGGHYGSVISSDPRKLECNIEDFDATGSGNEGVANAWLCYKVNEEAFDSTAMNLISGDDINGTWQGTIPGGLIKPGYIIEYYFSAADKDNAYRASFVNSYSYFQKQNPILFFYNDDTYCSYLIFSYYLHNCEKNGVPYSCDLWSGVTDGLLSSSLLEMYDYIIQIDGHSPVTMNDEAVGAWFESGAEVNPKHLFWSSQEWAFKFFSATDPNTWIFPADDWHSKYLGISQVTQQDINYPDPGEKAPFPIDPLAGDVISGKLADFIGDSLQLYYDPFGFCCWIDALIETPDAVVCFTDSAQGRTVGIHKETATSKSVFLTFDQFDLNLNTGRFDPWFPLIPYNVLDAALDWFNISITDIDEKIQPATPIDFNLAQNYPNPFNSETVIKFKIAKPAKVNLSIYNVMGQKVTELINDFLQPDIYHLNWNAEGLVSGVYFYQLETGEFTKIKKMVLVR